ncbi:uncharacterized protein LOC133181136 [Saccostrea echinata]|uniref:uncharacterized protein LOC133181136 n=1 Tax=Saccostrea echinata TaxID=191078 RepID=UPI002A7F4B1B|nr:uncharacterized protein LOC133181136 [Saccostrea echinata]
MDNSGNKSGHFQWTLLDPESNTEEPMKLAVTLHRILLPVIVLFGLIGNIISALVFTTTKLKKMSSSLYLTVLAISDSGFLVCVFMLWIDTLNVAVFDRPFVCQSLVYFTFVFSFLSVWIVNILTLEMYILTFYLSTRTLRLLNRNLAKVVIFFLTVFAMVLYVHNLWTVEVYEIEHGKSICIENSAHFVLIISFIDSLLTSIVPMVMMFVMTSRILLATIKDNKKETIVQLQFAKEANPTARKEIVYKKIDDKCLNQNNQRYEKTLSGSPNSRNVLRTRSRNQALCAYRKLRNMLITIFIVFFFLNLPQHVNKLQSQVRSLVQKGYVVTQNEMAVTHLLDLLFYLNFSINFLIYCGFTKQFRNHIFAIPIHSICALKNFKKNWKTNVSRKNLLQNTLQA